jgi:hypothetical protein
MREEKPALELPENVSLWEAEKIVYTFRAVKDRFDLDLFGEAIAGVNPHSGYAYIWSDSFPVSFFMPINCELQQSDVWALWTDPENGTEYEAQITDFDSIDGLNKWVEDCEAGRIEA